MKSTAVLAAPSFLASFLPIFALQKKEQERLVEVYSCYTISHAVSLINFKILELIVQYGRPQANYCARSFILVLRLVLSRLLFPVRQASPTSFPACSRRASTDKSALSLIDSRKYLGVKSSWQASSPPMQEGLTPTQMQPWYCSVQQLDGNHSDHRMPGKASCVPGCPS